ncbi:ArnT family glycosyltransferase [Paenibacillus herberti]|uniref:Glycosyltransferase RgtA/B/C/D-like domain-containing protein n=1 Tax=Paenibacillus herberti TaxID=1619309 RepID=A0A229NW63_9BACL|nr:glycosyltransferase family 39 protein [Paenibacillus herberti]OXM14111.1 hypothetical protein CGZ75_14130 [Paenibacillus herberti]
MNENVKEQSRPNGKLVLVLLLAVLLLGAFLRLDFLRSVEHQVPHDAQNYDIMVRQMLEQGVYAYKSTESNAQVTPGYPLFLAAMYGIADYEERSPFPLIRYIQAGISMAMLVLIYALGKQLAGRWAGLSAAALAAIYPPFIWSAGGILTETLAAFLLTLYVYLQLLAFRSERKPFMFLAGAVLGLTVLTRAEFLPLILLSHVVLLLWTRSWRQTLRQLVLCGAGLVLVLSPWVIRNVVTLGEVVITSTQQNPFTAGTYPDKNYGDGLVDREGKTQMEVARERLSIGFTEHTGTYLKWYTIGKLEHTYGRMFYGSGHDPDYPVLPLPLEQRNLYHRLLVGAGAMSIILLLWRWRHPAMLPAAIIVAMSGLRLLFVPEYRYNFTVMPLFIVIDCAVAALVWGMWRNRRRERTSFQESVKGGTS